MPKQQTEAVHPFFQKPADVHIPSQASNGEISSGHDQASEQTASPVSEEAGLVKPKPKRGRPPKSKGPRPLDALIAANAMEGGLQRGDITAAARDDSVPTSDTLEINDGTARKRRKLSPPDVEGLVESGVAVQSTNTEQGEAAVNGASDHSVAHSLATTQQALTSEAKKETPSPKRSKKVLKLNGAGTFGTPSSKARVEAADQATVRSLKRGRPKKQKRSFIVRIPYGTNDGSLRAEVARKIEAILHAPTEVAAPNHGPPAPKPAVNPSKPAHPFFSGKPGGANRPPRHPRSTQSQPDAIKAPSPQRPPILSATPGKLRRRILEQPRAVSPDTKLPIEPRSEKIFRLPGTFDAAFPPRGHQRVVPPDGYVLSPTWRTSSRRAFHKNRRKAHAATLPTVEGFLRLYTHEVTRRLSQPSEAQPRPVQRAVMSGDALRTHALKALAEAGIRQLDLDHPSLRRLSAEICSKRSAFDQGHCEKDTWTAKYSPRMAGEVLQSEKEVSILRGWLKSQVVASTRVDPLAASTFANLKGSKDGTSKRRKKRRKLVDEMDDFLANDDDATSLRDISDDEGSVTSMAPAMRSLVQDSAGQLSDSNRKTNAVLISGPHGCGKSAAVHAVARELGFDVFEIGPNARRSGRDLLDKVGDMARYHQVSRSKATVEPSITESISLYEKEDALPQERSQDQSPLTSFFSKCQTAKAQPKTKKVIPVKPSSKPEAQSETFAKAPPSQKQSVILLEEVDILFEQDRQFWETVVEFARGSRRPIIMTCNDETLVPVDDLSLHALLRFRAVPANMTTQYLTLLAAAEGHLVDPRSVRTLLQLKRHDLRASISQLQFWCQMGLGDSKGGLSWYLPQWPPGVSKDEQGQSLRVVSDGTFRAEHELPCGVFAAVRAADDQTLQEAWLDCGIHPGEASSAALEKRCHRDVPTENTPPTLHLQQLKEFEASTDLRSAIDVTSRVDLPSEVDSRPAAEGPLDPEQPPIPTTARGEYIEGYHLVDGQVLLDYAGLGVQLACFIHAGIVGWHGVPSPSSDLIRIIALEESQTEAPSRTRAMTRYRIGKALESVTDPLFEQGLCPAAVQDIAPYARSIASFDLTLERRRSGMAGIDTKMRSTRASRSALEGSQRSKTRRERWFNKNTDLKGLLATGGNGWPRPLAAFAPASHASSEPSSREASAGA